MGLMASFERGMERFLVPVAIKLNSQKHVAAVRDGFVFTFPIIMASSLIILINFAILSPDGFIAGLLHLNSIFPNLEKAQAIFTPVMNGMLVICCRQKRNSLFVIMFRVIPCVRHYPCWKAKELFTESMVQEHTFKKRILLHTLIT